MKKPDDWPRYMEWKELAGGAVAYYWRPRNKDTATGFPLKAESLGTDYTAAKIRCDGDPNSPGDVGLNGYLDAWRQGRGAEMSIDLQKKFGTVDWWFERYMGMGPYKNLSPRAKKDYAGYFRKIADTPTTDGRRFGDLMVKSISPAAADKLYERRKSGRRGPRLRQVNHEFDAARKAWKTVKRRYRDQFPEGNPFEGVERERSRGTVMPATREEAYILANQLLEDGQAPLGAAALICFEWFQRPENVLAGFIKWSDYRPKDRPNHIRIEHHKNKQMVWHPLAIDGELCYPEIEEYLTQVPRLGMPLVLMPARRGPDRPYSQAHAGRLLRAAREKARLPEHITLAACRHGGLTELGDSELTEQQGMAISAHKTPAAFRLYVKRTEKQILAATRKRRAWIEENAKATRVRMDTKSESE